MDHLAFAVATAQAAGERLQAAQKKGFEVSYKGGNPKDIVTTVDSEISSFIVGEIKRVFPDHSIYSEEGGDSEVASDYQWVIDPIDGSSNFSRGIPHFALCIGLLKKGTPIVGVVINPITRELFSFKKGGGAFLNGAPIHVSSVTDPKDAFVFLHAGRKPDVAAWGGQSYQRLLGTVKKTSNFGASALDVCFVAAGRIEANVYGTLTTLDIASALGILTEAGGVATDREGRELAFSKEPQRIYMANNQIILDTVRNLLET